MMAGEIEYENFIYENGDALFGFTGHAMILIFVVLVSIILMNLLVGLAVSDIQVIIFELIESWLNHKKYFQFCPILKKIYLPNWSVHLSFQQIERTQMWL